MRFLQCFFAEEAERFLCFLHFFLPVVPAPLPGGEALVAKPVPLNATAGPPMPVLGEPVLDPAAVGVNVTVIGHDWAGCTVTTITGGQVLVWEKSPVVAMDGVKIAGPGRAAA